ncbi:MAG: right-handed parallel beta-helix repeat-containing protein [Deltaproteobacteria bacterium]|nr:right-handed parallel beta-helix repeat-containing protein [Deltaproteobacteria bacterium]
MAAGDTCNVASGTYDERVTINTPGNSGAPITYAASGKVIMKGFTINASYITIRGFEITNTDADWTDGPGIIVTSGNNCLIENNYVYEATYKGIVTSSSTSSCTIKNNRLYRNGMVGVEVAGNNNTVEGNEIWGTIQHHPKWPNPPGADADGIRFFGSGHVIRNNHIHDITYNDPENVDPHIDCFQTWGDSWNQAGSDIVFEKNLCVALESHATRENGHGFMLQGASGLVIRNNIIRTFGGINTGGGECSNLTIINNLFASDPTFPVDRSPIGIGLFDAPNCTIKNNIFYNQPSHIIYVTGSSGTGLDVGYNLMYRSDGKSLWGSPYPHDLWGVNPKFVAAGSDFHLASDSPCIDAGAGLSMVTNDFDGNSRPEGNAYDIGPYEQRLVSKPTSPKNLRVLP